MPFSLSIFHGGPPPLLELPSSGDDPAMSEEGDEPPFPPLSPEVAGGLSDESLEALACLKQQAEDALEDGDHGTALKHLTAAVELGCATALLYCKRASVLLELGRPRAAARDCTAALDANPDSGKAYRIRARARLASSLFSPQELEMLLSAQADYRQSLAIDDDEATAAEAREVDARVRELQARAEAEKSAAALAARQVWEIVGGADKGGVIVREGIDLTSPQVPIRLATGAMVREVELHGERLRFEKVSGAGPDEGWISTALKEKVLACRVTAGERAARGDAEDHQFCVLMISPHSACETRGIPRSVVRGRAFACARRHACARHIGPPQPGCQPSQSRSQQLLLLSLLLLLLL